MIEIDELVFSNYNLLEFVLNGFGIDSILVILDYNVGTFFIYYGINTSVIMVWDLVIGFHFLMSGQVKFRVLELHVVNLLVL